MARFALALGGGGRRRVALLALAISIYRRDARESGRGWQYVLTALRLAVLVSLAAIALNPQERTRQIAYRPSRVAVLIDTSLSMGFPETAARPSESTRTRAEAVRDLMTGRPFFPNYASSITCACTRSIRL